MGRGSLWTEAFQLFRDMPSKNVHPDLITHNIAISVCEDENNWEQALVVFGMLKSSSFVPIPITWNLLLSSCLKGAAWQEAVELLHEIPPKHAERQGRNVAAVLETLAQ